MAEPAPIQPPQQPSDPNVGRWTPAVSDVEASKPQEPAREIGGRKDGSDPTRYGDWEKNGRCIDF